METYFTIEELGQYLKVAEQSIRRWVLNREIPYLLPVNFFYKLWMPLFTINNGVLPKAKLQLEKPAWMPVFREDPRPIPICLLRE